MAEDAFLPRWLTKRGHRLVFSNGIIVLAVLSCTLLAVVGANVNNLVPFYAIGVFTAFTMAGFGMAKYHHRQREPGWRHKLVINFSAGVTSLVVVLIFAVVKFTEGAWLVVIVFAIGVPVLIRLNRQYRMEARVLEGIGSRAQRRRAAADLLAPHGLRLRGRLRPRHARRAPVRAEPAADHPAGGAFRDRQRRRPTKLRQDWLRANTGVALDFVDCPDRRLARAAAELVNAEAALPGVGVTAVLPRRSYAPLLGRLLHDRTADKIAGVVSRIPHAAATIVPFDVRSRLEALHGRPGGPGDHPLKAVPADGAAPPVPAGGGTARPGQGPETRRRSARRRRGRQTGQQAGSPRAGRQAHRPVAGRRDQGSGAS